MTKKENGDSSPLNELEALMRSIKPLDEAAMARTRARMDALTKPPGSLGRLEDLAVQLAGISGGFFPCNSRKRVVVMAGDHGVTAEGVSAYPTEVTGQMLANFAAGGAAVNVLAGLAGVEVVVVDMGIFPDLELPGVKKVRVRPGTGNICREPAMSRREALQAFLAGAAVAREAALEGVQVLATGEMGIGNTTASSAVMAALTGYDVSLVVGRGTGLDDARLSHKIKVVERALELHRPDPADPLAVLAAVGGLELAGLAGLVAGAAAERIPVVVDGFISTVSALAAVRMNPLIAGYLVPSHLSAESGHALLLNHLELQPYLNMGMRLGEGTGAVLAAYLVEAAARITREMATFEDAGVSRSSGEQAQSKVGERSVDENILGSARPHHGQ